MTRKQYRRTRRLIIVLAAAPLFQALACKTGTSQTLQFVANQLPATLFSLFESALLSPLFALLGSSTSSLGTGGLGSTGGLGGGI